MFACCRSFAIHIICVLLPVYLYLADFCLGAAVLLEYCGHMLQVFTTHPDASS